MFVQVQPQFDVVSIGRAAAMFGVPLAVVESAVVRLQLVPPWRLNGVVMLNGLQIEQLRAHLRKQSQPVGTEQEGDSAT